MTKTPNNRAWWLVLPVLLLGVWSYFTDGRLRRAPWRRRA